MRKIRNQPEIFYFTYALIPFLMLVIVLERALSSAPYVIQLFQVMLGLCLLVYGIMGVKEAFLHG